MMQIFEERLEIVVAEDELGTPKVDLAVFDLIYTYMGNEPMEVDGVRIFYGYTFYIKKNRMYGEGLKRIAW